MRRGITGHGEPERTGPDQVNAALARQLIGDALAQLSGETPTTAHPPRTGQPEHATSIARVLDPVPCRWRHLGKMTSDASVAWQLADAASPCLIAGERAMIFVQLGCGENHLATERILAVVVRESFPLPAALLTTLKTWLDLYVGTPEERRLRALVARVRRHAN